MPCPRCVDGRCTGDCQKDQKPKKDKKKKKDKKRKRKKKKRRLAAVFPETSAQTRFSKATWPWTSPCK